MILKAFKDMEFQKISPRWGFISAVNFFITKISLLRSADAPSGTAIPEGCYLCNKENTMVFKSSSDDIKK